MGKRPERIARALAALDRGISQLKSEEKRADPIFVDALREEREDLTHIRNLLRRNRLREAAIDLDSSVEEAMFDEGRRALEAAEREITKEFDH